MLKDAHLGLEKMSVVAQAVKEERWGDAKRELGELRRMLDQLDDALGTVAIPQDEMANPTPRVGDRG